MPPSSNNKPKPNQPCLCGSGRKFKKCCFLIAITTSERNKEDGTNDCEGAKCSPTSKCECDESNCYRFKIGDRVEANVGTGKGKTFRLGTIVAIDYYENGWLGSVPYQICLDEYGGKNVAKYIYAPFDDDDCVRAAPIPVAIPPTSTPANKRRLRPSTTSHCTNNIRERVTT